MVKEEEILKELKARNDLNGIITYYKIKEFEVLTGKKFIPQEWLK